jgi:shikimate kinase
MVSPRVVLIGPPGSGKSATAAALAARWGVEAHDTDVDIVARDGRDIPTIFLEDGEAGFRVLEREAVHAALTHHQGVLALGGGAILDSATQRDLESYVESGGNVVYLVVSPGVASNRVGLSQARPLLIGDTHHQWVRLMDQRREIYGRLATYTISTDNLTPEETASSIAQSVGAS